MPRDAGATRTALLDAAESLILDHGFSATSVDKVIERAGVTKGTFFYHFKTKADLARALVERYARLDLEHLESTLGRAEQLSRDPLQQILIFIGLFKEEAEAFTEPYPGCLFASYCYEAELFDAATLAVAADVMRSWRARLGTKFAEAVAAHPPRLPADAEALADKITVVFEGAFIVSKVLNEPKVVAAQLGLYRDYIELLFSSDR
jgi:TetR/AcrR family transcriptional repressor of nem operon